MRKLRTIEMNRLTLEEFKEAEKLPLVVVLDDVRSLYNVGSVFRSCDAFRVEAVYLCDFSFSSNLVDAIAGRSYFPHRFLLPYFILGVAILVLAGVNIAP